MNGVCRTDTCQQEDRQPILGSLNGKVWLDHRFDDVQMR